jgi:hypothetical protein
MEYVKHSNFFGVETKENTCITGSGAPSAATVGIVGLFYMDSDTGDVYKCVAAADGVYTWGRVGGVPAVTEADDGKFLRVVSGAWAAVAIDSAEGASF